MPALLIKCKAQMTSKKHLFKVVFFQKDNIFEIYAKQVFESDMYGFIVVEDILFGEASPVLVDPSEEKLRNLLNAYKNRNINSKKLEQKFLLLFNQSFLMEFRNFLFNYVLVLLVCFHYLVFLCFVSLLCPCWFGFAFPPFCLLDVFFCVLIFLCKKRLHLTHLM